MRIQIGPSPEMGAPDSPPRMAWADQEDEPGFGSEADAEEEEVLESDAESDWAFTRRSGDEPEEGEQRGSESEEGHRQPRSRPASAGSAGSSLGEYRYVLAESAEDLRMKLASGEEPTM